MAAGIGDNSSGVAGVAYGCTILPVKVTDNSGVFVTDAVLGNAIRYAANFADVISCSWGGGASSTYINQAVDYAISSGRNGLGCPVFFASGNFASRWGYGGSRIKLSIASTGIPAGTYFFGFYYQRGANAISGEKIGIDDVCVLNSNGFDHIAGFANQTFEAGLGGWANNSTNLWAVSTTNALKGTGGTNSVFTPVLSSTNQVALLRSPSVVLAGTEILSFQNYVNLDSSALYYVLIYTNTGGSYVGGYQLSPGSSTEIAGVQYPANYSNSIAIGASTDCNVRSDYSQYGNELWCVAPSSGGWNDIYTTDISGASGYETGDYVSSFGGTSAATPIVAGVAALALSKNSSLTFSQLKTVISNSCDKIGGVIYDANGWHQQYGYGKINAYRAITNTPTDSTAPTISSVTLRTGRSIAVVYSERMGNGALTLTNYVLSGTGLGTMPVNPATVRRIGWMTYLLEWNSKEMAAAGTTTLNIANVKDIAGNGVTGTTVFNLIPSRVIYAFNCGKGIADSTLSPFESERNFWSGAGNDYDFYTIMFSATDSAPVAPSSVYNTEKGILTSPSYPGTLSYTIPNITAATNHTVRLYFATDGYNPGAGAVVFDIIINGTTKAANFDLNANGVSSYQGFFKDYTNITANGSGQIVVTLDPKLAWSTKYSAYYYGMVMSGVKITAQ